MYYVGVHGVNVEIMVVGSNCEAGLLYLRRGYVGIIKGVDWWKLLACWKVWCNLEGVMLQPSCEVWSSGVLWRVGCEVACGRGFVWHEIVKGCCSRVLGGLCVW